MTDPTPTMKLIKYETPTSERPRKIVWLARTDRLLAAAQLMVKGGEQVLHSHKNLDGFWFVLAGRARFYSDKETAFAEVGRHEGVLVPRGAMYWFEAVGAEPLEILQLEAAAVPFKTHDDIKNDVTYFGARSAPGSVEVEDF